uniref:Uncharacterized protein n=1 Tax=Octopus bimaculoides TaxID=37653 RepID=A0A0L8HNU3_OCTBM
MFFYLLLFCFYFFIHFYFVAILFIYFFLSNKSPQTDFNCQLDCSLILLKPFGKACAPTFPLYKISGIITM